MQNILLCPVLCTDDDISTGCSQQSVGRSEHISSLINVRDYSVGHSSAVRVPGQSVFGSALFLISGLSVDEQNGEIYDIEVRQNMQHS